MIYLKKGTLFRMSSTGLPWRPPSDSTAGLFAHQRTTRLGILLSDIDESDFVGINPPISYWQVGSTRTRSSSFRLMMATRFEVLSEDYNRDLLNIKFFEDTYRRMEELAEYESSQNVPTAKRHLKDCEMRLRNRLIFIKEICSGKSTQEVQSINPLNKSTDGFVINPLNKSTQEVQSTNSFNKSAQEIDSINPLNKSTQEICSGIYKNSLEVLERKGIRSVSILWDL